MRCRNRLGLSYLFLWCRLTLPVPPPSGSQAEQRVGNFFHTLPLQNIRETNEGGFSSLALAELGTTMGEEHRAGPSPLVNFRSESSRVANHRLAKN